MKWGCPAEEAVFSLAMGAAHFISNDPLSTTTSPAESRSPTPKVQIQICDSTLRVVLSLAPHKVRGTKYGGRGGNRAR